MTKNQINKNKKSMQRIHKSKAFNMGGDVFVSVNAQYD